MTLDDVCPCCTCTQTRTYKHTLPTNQPKDKLAYFLLLDGRDRHAWSKLLLQRMKEKMETIGHRNIDLSLSRVLFYKPEFEDDMSSLYQV